VGCNTTISPGQSIQSALDGAASGTIVCLRGGTYVGNTTWTRAPSSHVTLRSTPGELATLRPSDSCSGKPLNTTTASARLRIVALRLTSAGTSCPSAGGLIDSYGSFIEIVGNDVTASADNGIYTDEASDHHLIDGNWIHHNGTVVDGNQDHGIYLQGDDHVVRNNLIHDHAQGFGTQAYDYGLRNTIVGNTFVHNGFGRPCCGGLVIGGSKGSQAVIRGNIAWDNQSDGISFDSSCPRSGTLVERNVADGIEAACSSTVSLGSGNRTSDPLFVDLAARNLHLRPGSPAINYGDNAWLPSVDFDGQVRDRDVGAFEDG
jgi:hypothetical protein